LQELDRAENSPEQVYSRIVPMRLFFFCADFNPIRESRRTGRDAGTS
jgi:hypothetical protein